MGKATILSNLGDGLYEVSQDIGTGVDRNLQTWCVDYTDNATGEVATIEIPGEPKYTLIAPGARAPTAADGRLLARQVMTGPQAYFNAAILPGWQKFKPTYRRGTITALDGDVATVALADDRSSAQNLAINQASTLSGVPIVYQDCNGEAFEVGDECVVEFQGQNWNNPKVIGFQSNPKTCGGYFVFGKYISPPITILDWEDWPESLKPGPLKYFGTSGSYRWNAKKWQAGYALGQNEVWIGKSGKTVSWRRGGDPYNYLYVVYNNNPIDLSSIYEYQQFLSVNLDYYNENYWYITRSYAGFCNFQISGAAVYSEAVGQENHDILYFVCAYKAGGGGVLDFNYGYENYQTLTGSRYSMYLYFYKKDLVTGQITKLWEKSFPINRIYQIPGEINPSFENYGNSLTILNDAKYGPKFILPTGLGEAINYGINVYGGFDYKVSFHNSEIIAVGAVIQNYQTGLLYMTPSGNNFVAGNQIAAEYHPENNNLCTANLIEYTRLFNPFFPDGTTISWTVVLSEGGSFSYNFNTKNSTGLIDKLNLCYPNNNITFSYNYSTNTTTRNFFNNEFVDSFFGNFNFTGISSPARFVASSVLDGNYYSPPRILFVKEKYFCVFYTSSNVPKLLSSEFTQQEFESDSGVTVNDVSGIMRIGYTNKL